MESPTAKALITIIKKMDKLIKDGQELKAAAEKAVEELKHGKEE